MYSNVAVFFFFFWVLWRFLYNGKRGKDNSCTCEKKPLFNKINVKKITWVAYTHIFLILFILHNILILKKKHIFQKFIFYLWDTARIKMKLLWILQFLFIFIVLTFLGLLEVCERKPWYLIPISFSKYYQKLQKI